MSEIITAIKAENVNFKKDSTVLKFVWSQVKDGYEHGKDTFKIYNVDDKDEPMAVFLCNNGELRILVDDCTVLNKKVVRCQRLEYQLDRIFTIYVE